MPEIEPLPPDPTSSRSGDDSAADTTGAPSTKAAHRARYHRDMPSILRRVPLSPRRRTVGVAAAMVLALLAGGFYWLTSGPSAAQKAAAAGRWGDGIKPGAHADLQPDVVTLTDGELAIRKVSPDGLTWTLDGGYSGVRRIAPGKVLYATNRAVGRVLQVAKLSGNEVAVTMYPVPVGSIFRNLSVHLDEPVEANNFTAGGVSQVQAGHYEEPTSAPESDAPDTPQTSVPTGAVADTSPAPTPSDAPSPSPTALSPRDAGYTRLGSNFAAAPIAAPPSPAPNQDKYGPGGAWTTPTPSPSPSPSWSKTPTTGEVSLGDWSFQANFTNTRMEWQASKKVPGLKLGLDGALTYQNLRLEGGPVVQNGIVHYNTFLVKGLKSFEVGFAGGAPNGIHDDRKFRIEIPWEFSKTIWIEGFPLFVQAKIKFYVATGFSAKNATMSASAAYSLNGDLGVLNGTAIAPTTTQVKSLMDEFTGTSVGIDSVVFASEFRFLVGAGVDFASAGEYVKILESFSLLRGSDLTSWWGVPCQSTITVQGGYGTGLSLNSNSLRAMLGPLGDTEFVRFALEKFKKELEVNENLKELYSLHLEKKHCASAIPAGTQPLETPAAESQEQGNDPYTAADAPPRPGPAGRRIPPADRPVTQAQENPSSPNQGINPDDGLPTGPVPPPGDVPGQDNGGCVVQPGTTTQTSTSAQTQPCSPSSSPSPAGTR